MRPSRGVDLFILGWMYAGWGGDIPNSEERIARFQDTSAAFAGTKRPIDTEAEAVNPARGASWLFVLCSYSIEAAVGEIDGLLTARFAWDLPDEGGENEWSECGWHAASEISCGGEEQGSRSHDGSALRTDMVGGEGAFRAPAAK